MLGLVVGASPSAAAGAYRGPLTDAHSHLPSAGAVEALVAAMDRHQVARVVLLGVGGVQRDDPVWIAAAARKYPDRIIPGLPLPDPVAPGAGAWLEAALRRSAAPVVGEVHLRQVSRGIQRSPMSPGFLAVLEVAGRHGVPVVVHYELDDEATGPLEQALAARRATTVILAHAGATTAGRIGVLLGRHPNLRVDLSGMHFLRTPRLATERGPLDPAWKAAISALPDRFLMGLDVWAPRLFEPAMLDRLMVWTRRVLGELPPEAAERVAHGNATAVFGGRR